MLFAFRVAQNLIGAALAKVSTAFKLLDWYTAAYIGYLACQLQALRGSGVHFVLTIDPTQGPSVVSGTFDNHNAYGDV